MDPEHQTLFRGFKGGSYVENPYFSDTEKEGLDPLLLHKLEHARHISDVPYILTSKKRDRAGNADSGGKENSAHLDLDHDGDCEGVDIQADTSHARYRILYGLFGAGFTRIGIYDKHIHADIDKSKDQEVSWLGVST